jgi:xanthine dehydrogenase accessory factor
MIGSRAKVHRIWERLRARGADPERLWRVRAPIGLDLAAREPGEIAVAIVAELVWERRGRRGGCVPMRLPSEGG